uniref:Uncharacterized protein n=1 Tax=Brassica oleracea TaxID=3712 RepID=A0A3P6BAQ5_BRAOL|nr:unnamed protein product [Brassica oleracea]
MSLLLCLLSSHHQSSSDSIDFRKRLGIALCRDSNQLYGSGGTVYGAGIAKGHSMGDLHDN